MPKETLFEDDFFAELARLRCRWVSEGNFVVELMIQLEVFDDGAWKVARRYDDAHGQPHIDLLDRRGREYDKIWLEHSRNEAVTLALADLNRNWKKYTDDFLERWDDGQEDT